MTRNRQRLHATFLAAGLLTACGTQTHETAATFSATARPTAPRYLHVLQRVPRSVRDEDLATEYRGTVISRTSELGHAIIASNNPNRGRYDVHVEPNDRNVRPSVMNEAGYGMWSSGYGMWSTGYSMWSSGYDLWSNGTSTSATTFTDNRRAWDLLRLSGAQALAPEYGRGVKVAVIDTGIDLKHPAFSGRIDTWNARDYVGGDSTPQEVNAATDGTYSSGYGHGTAVANLVLQVAPNATILPIRVIDPAGMTDTSTVASAISYAVSRGARIINLSLGGTTNSYAINQAIADAAYRGVVVVCAAGNSGTTSILYPAAAAMNSTWQGLGSVSVGSVSVTNYKSSFSTYGSALEISAPGEGLRAAFPNGQTAYVSGTSFAAPVVSGVLALAASAGVSADASSMMNLMKNLDASATPPSDPKYWSAMGYGTVNAAALLGRYR